MKRQLLRTIEIKSTIEGLNFLKEVILGDHIGFRVEKVVQSIISGSIVGFVRGVTRSLDYSSYAPQAGPTCL